MPGQRAIVHHSSLGFFALREGKWKLIDRQGSGGFSEPQQIDAGAGQPQGQLYDLSSDPGETENLFTRYPERVATMQKLLDEIRGAPRGSAAEF